MSPIPDIEGWFNHHHLTPEQGRKVDTLRGVFKAAALTIAEMVPYSAEYSNALRYLRQASMWANAGVACNPETPIPVKEAGLLPPH